MFAEVYAMNKSGALVKIGEGATRRETLDLRRRALIVTADREAPNGRPQYVLAYKPGGRLWKVGIHQ